MNSIALRHKPRNVAAHPPLQALRLLDQLLERLRYLHYSLRTEQAHLCWTQ